jgi:hypothetical protein
MTPYFFHESVKTRHSRFLVMIPDYFQGRSKVRLSALSISCIWTLIFSGNDRRYVTLSSCLWSMTTSGDNNKATALPGTIQGWYYHFLFRVPDYFRGQSKYTHFLYMVPGYFLGRHSLMSCLWPLTFSTNDPRHGTLQTPFPVYDPLLFPV